MEIHSGGKALKKPGSMRSSEEKNTECVSVNGKKQKAIQTQNKKSGSAERFESRPNNLDFYDWQPCSMSKGDRDRDGVCEIKKRNEDREQERLMSYLQKKFRRDEDGTESEESNNLIVNRQRDPNSSQRHLITNGREHLISSDTDEVLNKSKEKLANDAANEKDAELPDSDKVVEQLVHIQKSIKQTTAIFDKIAMLPEPMRTEQRTHLNSILMQLKEEEHGYKVLLQGIMAAQELDERLISKDSASGDTFDPDRDVIMKMLKRGRDTDDESEQETRVKQNNRRGLFNEPRLNIPKLTFQVHEGDDEDSTVAGSEISAVSIRRHSLEEKLRDLKEKKSEMDDLLKKLHLLNLDQSDPDNDIPEESASSSLMNSLQAAASASRTASDAEKMLTKMETRQKLKKLKAVRERLEQLKALSQFYQNANEDDILEVDDAGSENLFENDEDNDEQFVELLARARSPLNKGWMQNGQQNGHSEELFQHLGASGKEIAPIRMKEKEEEEDVDEEKDVEEVERKLRQIEDAGNMLQKLQQLVSLIQQSSDADQLPNEETLALAVSQNCDINSETLSAKGDIENETDEFFSDKMRQQQHELQELMEERQRLLSLRSELDRIQSSFPQASIVNDKSETVETKRVRHPLDGKWVTSDQRKTTSASNAQETMQVKFQEPLENVMSNEELYDQMRLQRMLREEMREKKKETSNGDVAPKRNFSSEDSRNEGASTYRSEQYSRTSPSEDITMATWGGSTAGNLESIEENENQSVDDTEDDEDDEKDDEDDNLLQVEEEEEEDALNDDDEDDDDDDDDEEEDDGIDRNDSFDAAPSRRWKLDPPNIDRRKLRSTTGFNKESISSGNHLNNQLQQQRGSENSTLFIVRESVRSLKKQMSQLSNTVKKSLQKSRSRKASMPSEAAQLQQNQLFLGLNQSYFQLVATQNDLSDRFSRLEHLVLGSADELETERFGPRPVSHGMNGHPVVKSSRLDASPASHPRELHRRLDVADSLRPSSLRKTSQSSSVHSVDAAAAAAAAGGRMPEKDEQMRSRPLHKFDYSVARQPERKIQNGKNVEKMSKRQTNASKSPCFETAEEMRIQCQNLSVTRATALAQLASQKVMTSSKDDSFLRAVVDDVSISSEPTAARKMESQSRNIDSSFDGLSDEIYSEVATLISQNEQRPEFLVELFHKLQFLSTDFLRQRALYAIHDLMSSSRNESTNIYHNGSKSVDAVGGVPRKALPEKSFMWDENTDRSSAQSTPSPSNTSQLDHPFAQDPLSDTVIHFDQMMKIAHEQERAEAQHREAAERMKNRPTGACADIASRWIGEHSENDLRRGGGRGGQNQEMRSDGSVSDDTCPRIDTQDLDKQIKEIMMEVIPVVKEHIGSVCSQQFLQFIQRLVLSLAHKAAQHDTQAEFVRFFQRQLTAILNDSLAKFEGHKILDCGEDLLVDLSEILFNELAFFRLMQNLDQSKDKVKAKLLTWHKDSAEEASPGNSVHKKRKLPVDVNGDSSSDSDETAITDSELESVNQEKDETVAVNQRDMKTDDEAVDGNRRSNKNEEMKTRNERDGDGDAESVGDEFLEEDDFYTDNMRFLNDSEDIGDSFSIEDEDDFRQSNVKIELAPSETKPFTRIGSDEDDEAIDEAASADDPYETAVSRDAEKERCSKESTSSATSSSASIHQQESNRYKTSMAEEENMNNLTSETTHVITNVNESVSAATASERDNKIEQ